MRAGITGFLLLSLLGYQMWAQAPADYYTQAEGLNGEALKAALNDIIDDHVTLIYDDVWDALKVADRDPDNASNVIGFYSRFSMDAATEYAGGNGWNREHVWAKSRGDFGTSRGPGTDLHHLRATDVSTNSARGNKGFGTGTNTYTDQSGNYSGSTPCKASTSYWEPGDDQKGDVARMIFYMAVRYEGEDGELDLELTEEILENTDKRPIHGQLSSLLSWHEADPVTNEERTRNDVVYSYQQNRNPFIDHPEWVEMIWDGEEVPTEPEEGEDNWDGANADLELNVSTLAFSEVSVGSFSEPLPFEIIAEGLQENLTIASSSGGFKVSDQPTAGYTTSLELSPVSGTIEQTLYVVLNPAAIGYQSAVLRLSSTGATTSLNLSGTAIAAPLSLGDVSRAYVWVDGQFLRLMNASFSDQVVILDEMGRKVMLRNSPKLKVDITALNSGVYFLVNDREEYRFLIK